MKVVQKKISNDLEGVIKFKDMLSTVSFNSEVSKVRIRTPLPSERQQRLERTEQQLVRADP